MPIELGVSLKHEKSWNIRGFYDQNTQEFQAEFFQINDVIPQKRQQWPKILCHESHSYYQQEKTYENKNWQDEGDQNLQVVRGKFLRKNFKNCF
jgi:hypothetical protein